MIDILFHDDVLVAVNKPSGLLVHKSWVAKDAKEFALQTVRDQIGCHVYPIHRLDRPTSGVLLFAKSADIAARCAEAWPAAQKIYWAIVRGYFPAEVFVDHPLKTLVDYGEQGEAQEAQTAFRCLQQFCLPIPVDKYPEARYSLVEAKPQQGRTHQIRRHLKHLSHPIIGDPRYGKSVHNYFFTEHLGSQRLLLHARELHIKHPVSGADLIIRAPLDNAMQHIFSTFNWLTTE